MKTGWWKTSGLGGALVAIVMAASATDTVAQVDDRDCRCVDADGSEIENCLCIVMPDLTGFPDELAWRPGEHVGRYSAPRPRLGVTVSTDQDGATDAQGARVARVMEDGPADLAGIREGDVITGVDGLSLLQPLAGASEEDFDLDGSIPVQRLLEIARALEPGESVEVDYLRDGESRTAAVEVEDLGRMWGAWARDFNTRLRPRVEELRMELAPRLEELRDRMSRFEGAGSGGTRPGTYRYGLSLVELTPGLGGYFGTDHGVLVLDVDQGSRLGLLPGDVILRIGDREVTTPQRVRRILSGYEGEEGVPIRVRRRGSEIDILGRLGG